MDVGAVITAAPTPVTGVGVGTASGKPLLTWSDVGGIVDHYEVWRSSKPYFAPGELGAEKLATVQPPAVAGGSLSYSDTGAHTGDPATNDFYIVLSVNAAGQAALVSNRVGTF